MCSSGSCFSSIAVSCLQFKRLFSPVATLWLDICVVQAIIFVMSHVQFKSISLLYCCVTVVTQMGFFFPMAIRQLFSMSCCVCSSGISLTIVTVSSLYFRPFSHSMLVCVCVCVADMGGSRMMDFMPYVARPRFPPAMHNNFHHAAPDMSSSGPLHHPSVSQSAPSSSQVGRS